MGAVTLELLKTYLDAGLLGLLGFMSFLTLAFTVERYLFFARVELGSFRRVEDLEIALTRHLTAVSYTHLTLPTSDLA